MVETLATFINPTSPTPQTMDLIMGNAINWGYNTIQILEDHYKEQLEKALEDLPTTPPADLTLTLEIAGRWTRRDLPCLKEDTIDHAQAQILAHLENDTNTTMQCGALGQLGQTTTTRPNTTQNNVTTETQMMTNNKNYTRSRFIPHYTRWHHDWRQTIQHKPQETTTHKETTKNSWYDDHTHSTEAAMFPQHLKGHPRGAIQRNDSSTSGRDATAIGQIHGLSNSKEED